MSFGNITTRDVIAVLVVGATLVFNGISLTTGRPVDATTIGLAGAIVGYYFRDRKEAALEREDVSPPSLPGDGD